MLPILYTFYRLLAHYSSSLKHSYRNDYQGTTLIHIHIIYTTSLITLLLIYICLCINRLDLVAFLCVTVFLSTYDKLRSSAKEWIGKVKICKLIYAHVSCVYCYSHSFGIRTAFNIFTLFYVTVYYLFALQVSYVYRHSTLLYTQSPSFLQSKRT